MKYLYLFVVGLLVNFSMAFGQTENDSTVINDTIPFYSDSLVFYDFISPNGDGINDYFVVEYINQFPYREFQLMIYNVWGDLVYLNKDYRNDFGGRGNATMMLVGNELPQGVYYYTLIDPLFVKHTGKLTIKR